MGLTDKAKHAAQRATGRAKEATGKVTDNPDLEAEGRTDQTKASVKKIGEDLKDTLK